MFVVRHVLAPQVDLVLPAFLAQNVKWAQFCLLPRSHNRSLADLMRLSSELFDEPSPRNLLKLPPLAGCKHEATVLSSDPGHFAPALLILCAVLCVQAKRPESGTTFQLGSQLREILAGD